MEENRSSFDMPGTKIGVNNIVEYEKKIHQYVSIYHHAHAIHQDTEFQIIDAFKI
jgi:hypothetical protein